MRPDRNSWPTLAAVAAVCTTAAAARGTAAFTTTFDAGQPAGTTLLGSAVVDATGGVGDTGKLRLTDTGLGELGSLVLPDLNPGSPITGFTASFDLLIGGGTGADGVSFDFGSPPGTAFGETGYATSHSLAVSFDTFNNEGEAPAVNLFVNDATANPLAYAAHNPTNPETGGAYVPVTVTYANGRLDATFDSTDLFPGGVSVAGFTPAAGDVFGLGGRTGGYDDDHFVDDLTITTTSVPEPAAAGAAFVAAAGLGRRRRSVRAGR